MPKFLIQWRILINEGWKFMPEWSVRFPVGLCLPQWPLLLQLKFSLDFFVKNVKSQIPKQPFPCWFDDFLHRFQHYTTYPPSTVPFWSFLSQLQHISSFEGKPKKSWKPCKWIKLKWIVPYLVRMYSSVQIYEKCCQISKKKATLLLFWQVLVCLTFLVKVSLQGQQRPAEDHTDHSGINFQPSLTRIHN